MAASKLVCSSETIDRQTLPVSNVDQATQTTKLAGVPSLSSQPGSTRMQYIQRNLTAQGFKFLRNLQAEWPIKLSHPQMHSTKGTGIS